jgi:hypothetical protein
VATAPVIPPKRALVGTVSSVDRTRGQVMVRSGSEDLVLQLPADVVRDLRPGDQVSLDLAVRPVR